LSRPSTPFFARKEGVDARDERGHDDGECEAQNDDPRFRQSQHKTGNIMRSALR
jgi:hypothetical protein